MIIETERLILRPWAESDAESLFEYAKDPDVGPIAGWPAHTSVENSLDVIRKVFNGGECYAICEKTIDGKNLKAIGAIELKLNGHTDMTERDDECELGYWLGKPFWGRGYMPEAATRMLQRAFEEIGMTTVWCGYYDGNTKSKRVQEKIGLIYHHTATGLEVPLMGEVRTGHTNYLTREMWLRQYTIVEAKEEDVEELTEHIKRASKETNLTLEYYEELEKQREMQINKYISLIRDPQSFVVVVKSHKKIVGFASLVPYAPFERLSHRTVFGVSLEKAYWNIGIGSKLINACFEFSRKHKIEFIDLEVHEFNKRAFAIYEKFGFVEQFHYDKAFKNKDGSYYELIHMRCEVH